MAKLTNEQFYDKWVPLLADNVFQDINGARFEQLLADLRDTFASADSQALTPVAPAVNFDPVLRQLTATHVLGTAALEYNQNNGGFTAYAPIQVDDLGHGQGEWRFRVKADTGRNPSQTTDSPIILVKGTGSPAGPGKIKSTDISDSTEAGRALLTAKDVAAQRKLLDNFVILAGQYGVGQPRFEHADGPDGVFAYMLRALASVSAPSAPTRPAAPSDGQVDDLGDAFSFLPPVGYSFAQLKVGGLPQTTGAEWLSAANCYVQNGRVYIRVVGDVPAGGLSVYVGASGGVPDGLPLTNADRFTANNVAPTVPGALAVDFTVDNASLSPGDTLGFTAKASGGTAPYQHSVQALNVDTGTITPLGSASTASYVGTWKAVAGVYLVTNAVSDAAGTSLVSLTRRVVVAYPGGGGGVPLTPATTTKLGGVIVGYGLAVMADGTLSTNLYDALGTQTDGAATVRLLKASLDALDARKPFVGLFGAEPPVGYDVLDAALGDQIAIANCAQATVENPTVASGRSFFANGAQISISDAVPVDDGSGNITYEAGSFGTEVQSKIHSIKLIPPDYYATNPAVHLGLVKTFRAYQAGFAGLPTPNDCTEFHSGSIIGYKLGLNGVAGGYVLVNSQATAGTTAGNLVIYLFGNSSISGPLGSGTTVVQPPGVAMPYVGTATKKQWVVKNRTYSKDGKEYKWLGADTQLNAFDATNANWLQTGGASTAGTGTGTGTSSGVVTSSDTKLVFTQDADYLPISSGTFTVDVTGAKVGVVVKAELGPNTTEPVLDATVFERVGPGIYQQGKRLGYGFCVAATGKIEYFIYSKP